MKISYNWLRTLIKTDLTPQQIDEYLTSSGLEVEGIETFESIKGGLQGIVIGEVIEKEKHPDADKLSITKVNVGAADLLTIVCGAQNVAAGQKVLVAMIGATLYPTTGEPFEIKKSKIRGVASEGMICAEDEIGLGTGHEGILVLPDHAKVGTPAAEFFKLEQDSVLEIGLTPNRADAASHYGVARDLAAILNSKNNTDTFKAELHNVLELPKASNINKVEVIIENPRACKRYSGLVISGITVKPSPDWLKNSLLSIGLRPINNIVDITNFVLHDLGQPLHAFDLNKITGNKIIVKTGLAAKTFKTLDGVERTLQAEDLMICNGSEPMCMAGVFGGLESGVSDSTTSVFIEAAYFDPAFIRKTSKQHGLKTDSSFRFERGTDPEMTITALKRAAALIFECAGGVLSMDVVDIYPQRLEPFKVAFSYTNCQSLIGKEIDRSIIKHIILSLGIKIEQEGNDGLLLAVPQYKTDVTREADVIEEVMRIYGYNNVEESTQIKFTANFADREKATAAENTAANLLIGFGFNEMMGLSLTKEAYYTEGTPLVKILNPLSADLNVMRHKMLFGGLETLAYNINRKQADLKLFEFGKTYEKTEADPMAIGFKYAETKHLILLATGRKYAENPFGENNKVDFSFVKSCIESVLNKLSIKFKVTDLSDEQFSYGLSYAHKNKQLVSFGLVEKSICKKMDVNVETFYADFNWDNVLSLVGKTKLEFTEIPKFPAVRRDLALLLDKKITYKEIEELAFSAERKLLKTVNLFDIYEGDKLEAGKKSYAVSFMLQDDEATLNDKQIDNVMQKLIKTYSEKLGATLR
ncbi:MAG: phenylalanine--tRNA ligase subunit beta [Bacteroidetes bacterium]|nr:phenylalanine--tRNA ligase subunit beta [Bacteroidota bacterium]MDF2453709.1 phenylalanine--tRNA ligase subunit beta [Bacteroidota bacterium]